jgi:hypothetical protein
MDDDDLVLLEPIYSLRSREFDLFAE